MRIGVTGHRPKALGLRTFNFKSPPWVEAHQFVTSLLRQSDVSCLLTGGQIGFDMVAGHAAVMESVPITLALPFEEYSNGFSKDDRTRLLWLVDNADKALYVCEPGYAVWKYQRRNEYIVDNCDVLLAFWNGKPSGTGNCVKYAENQGVDVVRVPIGDY